VLNRVNVLCYLWGDWKEGERYVHTLKNMVERHTTQPFDFYCITDRPVTGIECLPLKVDWFRRLKKMAAYDTSYGLLGTQFMFDLDVVITGNIDHILGYQGKFCTIEDFYRPRKPCGALNAWQGGDEDLEEKLYKALELDPQKTGEDTGGNERFWLEKQLGENMEYWQDLFPDQMFSAKPDRYTIRETIPDRARIVFFHGRQKNHEYTHLDWVKKHWQ